MLTLQHAQLSISQLWISLSLSTVSSSCSTVLQLLLSIVKSYLNFFSKTTKYWLIILISGHFRDKIEVLSTHNLMLDICSCRRPKTISAKWDRDGA